MGHIVAIGEDNQLRYVTVTLGGRWATEAPSVTGPNKSKHCTCDGLTRMAAYQSNSSELTLRY